MPDSSFNPVFLYETTRARVAETGQAVAIAKDKASGTYSLSTLNRASMVYGWAILERQDLVGLRDALNRELAS